MNSTEIINRLTVLAKEQADIIEQQAYALEQLKATSGFSDKISRLSQERIEIIGE